jgi:hypothetical protein
MAAMPMRLVVERTIGVTGRREKILRLPASWNDPRLEAGLRVRMVFDGTRIQIELLGEAKP